MINIDVLLGKLNTSGARGLRNYGLNPIFSLDTICEIVKMGNININQNTYISSFREIKMECHKGQFWKVFCFYGIEMTYQLIFKLQKWFHFQLTLTYLL